MPHITFLDDGLKFDGRTPTLGPIGGAEGALVALAETLATRDHDVTVLNRCEAPMDFNGVRWRPLGSSPVPRSDMYLVNRNPGLLDQLPAGCPATLWLHNNARYLRKWRHLSRLMRFNPTKVFLSSYHARTWPMSLVRDERCVIPLGVGACFRRREERLVAPAPRAVYASHPERGLSALLDLWVSKILPGAPAAELHLFTRADFYGIGAKSAATAEPILARARALHTHNVILHDMIPQQELAAFYQSARVMLYWGDQDHAETYCLSVAEAQAAGVPCVARPIGALPERVMDGDTGFLQKDPARFAASAVSLLTDDVLWRRLHRQAISSCGPSWEDAAQRFEQLHA